MIEAVAIFRSLFLHHCGICKDVSALFTVALSGQHFSLN